MHNIIVPGAAAPAGINAIKSLRKSNHNVRIIATDSNNLSAGFYFSDIGEVTPEADDPSFAKKLFELVKKYSITILLPTSGFDIYSYSENKSNLLEMNANAVVSDRYELEICRDKLLTYERLSNKFDLPYTTYNTSKINSFPCIAKPRYGKGSRDVILVKDKNDLEYVLSQYDEMIYQEYIPGVEYTIDVLSDLEGNPLLAVPRIRLQTKAGISTKGKVVRNSALEEVCMQIAKEIGIIGPCCIQVKERQDGTFSLIEVNPRMGGGTIFTTLAGANFPSMIIDMIDGKSITIPKIEEITVIRYYDEIVIRS